MGPPALLRLRVSSFGSWVEPETRDLKLEIYFASGISTFPTRLIASASILASLSQNFWNSGASRVHVASEYRRQSRPPAGIWNVLQINAAGMREHLHRHVQCPIHA